MLYIEITQREMIMKQSNRYQLTDEPIMSRKEAKQIGSATYFTGKVCPHGHIWMRSTKQAACLMCRAESSDRQADQRKHNKHVG